MTEFYTAGDGIKLEISEKRALDERGALLVWPCTGGAFQMYRVPVSSFHKIGISVIQFNPPGHGASEGQINYSAAMNYFREYLSEKIDPALPLIITGHSGGAGAVLSSMPETFTVKKFILVSPVLDSRESLFYMYRKNTIMEFNSLAVATSKDKEAALEILSNSEWMDPEVWRTRGLRDKLDSLSGQLKGGTFLENLFISGFSAFDELKKKAVLCEILLASEDNWYSRKDIMKAAEDFGIDVTVIAGARDHFFTGAWHRVWDIILRECGQVLN